MQISRCTEFWVSVTRHYTLGLLVENAVSIILKSFQNDLLTQPQCTENAFIYSSLPSTKLTDTHFLYSFIFSRLSRKYFTNVAIHILNSIFGRNCLQEAFVGINNLIILPELLVVSGRIYISTTTRMLVLRHSDMPHIVY